MQSHLQKLPPMAANLRRDDDERRRETTRDDDKRRETTTDDERRRHDASHANTAPTPRPPTINGNPSLRIREKDTSERFSLPVRQAHAPKNAKTCAQGGIERPPSPKCHLVQTPEMRSQNTLISQYNSMSQVLPPDPLTSLRSQINTSA